jgi:hypothetical protein
MFETFKVSITGHSIDRENFKISNVIVASKIKPKDSRRIVIDDTFISDFLKLTRSRELPVQADHNYSMAVGTKLGFIKEFSSDQDGNIRANIQFLKSADKSPINPGMVSFLIDSIDEDPKSYMLSMKVSVNYFYADDGRALRRSYDWDREEYTWRYTDNKELYSGNVHMKIKDVTGVDFVADGALTNSTFTSEEFVEHFNHLTTQPHIAPFIHQHFDDLIIGQLRKSSSFFDTLKKLFKMENTNPPAGDTPVETPAATAASTAPTATADYGTAIAELTTLVKGLQAELSALKPSTPAPAATAQASFAGENFSPEISSTTKKVPLYLENPINRALKEKFLKEN